MFCVIVEWRTRSYVVSVKEDQWVALTKIEIPKQLKQGYPLVFGSTPFNIDDLSFAKFPEDKTLVFPSGYINDNNYVLKAHLSWHPGEGFRNVGYYDAAGVLLNNENVPFP